MQITFLPDEDGFVGMEVEVNSAFNDSIISTGWVYNDWTESICISSTICFTLDLQVYMGVLRVDMTPSSGGEPNIVLRESFSNEDFNKRNREAKEVTYFFGYKQKTHIFTLDTCETATVPGSAGDSLEILPDTPQRYILNIASKLSGVDALRDPSTQQHKALLWMLHHNNFLEFSSTQKMIVQSYVITLLLFMQEGIKNHNILIPTNKHKCHWNGITCYEETIYNDTVKSINVSNHKLRGSLPFKIEELKGLQNLDLGSKNIIGSLPKTMANLEMLKSITVHNNSTSVTIATELGFLTELKRLSLGSNQFSGTLPTELGRLVKLRVLDIANNTFLGTIPLWLHNLQSLSIFNASQNGIGGSIPSEIFPLHSLSKLKPCRHISHF